MQTIQIFPPTQKSNLCAATQHGNPSDTKAFKILHQFLLIIKYKHLIHGNRHSNIQNVPAGSNRRLYHTGVTLHFNIEKTNSTCNHQPVARVQLILLSYEKYFVDSGDALRKSILIKQRRFFGRGSTSLHLRVPQTRAEDIPSDDFE